MSAMSRFGRSRYTPFSLSQTVHTWLTGSRVRRTVAIDDGTSDKN